MQTIHRSVGEPAEGSLTRYCNVTKHQTRTVFTLSFALEWTTLSVTVLKGILSGISFYRLLFWWTVSNGRSCRRCILSWRIIIFLCRCALLSLSADEETILNLFHPLFASWLYLCCSVLCSGAAVHTFNYLNVKITTLSNGYLGSRNDEERSEMRYVMRIAEFSESSNLWTQIALLGSPSSTPLSVSVQQSLSSVSACWLDNESPCALSCGLFKYIELWKPIPVLSLHLFSFGRG